MSTTVALFNNKGGVGKTTLAYHLAHMVARLGRRVLAADLDPQANLTSAFFDEAQLELLWIDGGGKGESTVLTAVQPMLKGLGDIVVPPIREAADRLWVLPGDLGLSRFEDRLSEAWPHGYDGQEAALRVTTAFHRILRGTADEVGAEVTFVDVGPNLGAINRSALLAADALLIPLAADLYSLQGLRNLGPTLRSWQGSWRQNVLPRAPEGLDMPQGTMRPLGYVVLQHAVRLDRPVKAYDRWLRRIPSEFHQYVLGEQDGATQGDGDRYRLASLRNYRSLMPLAQDARLPMFDLRPAHGALGSTGRLVQTCYREFEELAINVLRAIDLKPDSQAGVAASTVAGTAIPVAIGRAFAKEYLETASPGEVAALREGRPTIPPELDSKLLRSAEERLGEALWEQEQMRRHVRSGFWQTVLDKPT